MTTEKTTRDILHDIGETWFFGCDLLKNYQNPEQIKKHGRFGKAQEVVPLNEVRLS